jgi:NAD(P)-dependent dehydrogenase (short-subunit alcohol dehydrogenase family)
VKVALVTGAAGGLGRAVVTALESDGWDVAASDRPGTGVGWEADLRQPGACGQLVADVVAERSGLDLLVNNAATMYHGALDLSDLERWWDTIDVNLSAAFRLARSACGELRRRGGQVVNVASSHGVMAQAGFSAYCASKAGLIGLTKALALELAPEVRVNAIAPGHIDTPQQAVDADAAGITREALYDRYRSEIPLGRILAPEEVAELLVFLTHQTGFTGSCIHLNGGGLLV